MKKISILTAFFCLLLATTAVFAQDKATSFAGTWELDAAKSKLPERQRVESITLNVAQTDKELKVETNSKHAARPEGDRPMGDGSGGMRQGGGMGRGGMMGGGNGTVTYSLDGKETTVTVEMPAGMPASSMALRSKMEKDGKLQLTSNRNIETPNGAMSIKTTETWELLNGGNGLKVTRDTETMRGTQSSEMYFTRKVSSEGITGQGTVSSGSEVVNPAAGSGSQMSAMPKRISGGVLNGKAVQLVKPSYPVEARASRASGTVNVQVEIDEQGNVLSAKAVSGDSTLRAASEEAARNSKFAPTTLQGVPVKVTGVIVYNFLPQ
ncbi:MAG TPA: energy transducer TonB [Pyrinomonadaceae bacterium]|nr:energy transducer TonB [Pyrinomonadaceae bacterium]